MFLVKTLYRFIFKKMILFAIRLAYIYIYSMFVYSTTQPLCRIVLLV